MAMKIKGYTGAGCDTVVAVYVFLLQLRFGMQNLSPLPFSSPYFQSLVPTILHYGDFCNVNLPLCNGRFYSEWYTFLVNEYKKRVQRVVCSGAGRISVSGLQKAFEIQVFCPKMRYLKR